MANVSDSPKGRKPAGFHVAVAIGLNQYLVTVLPIDPDVGCAAYRFEKITQGGDRAVYDAHLDGFGLHCSCRGHERYRHCKHCDAVKTLACMFNIELPADPPKLRYRSSADLARNDPDSFAETMEDAPESEPWTDADFAQHAAYYGEQS